MSFQGNGSGEIDLVSVPGSGGGLERACGQAINKAATLIEVAAIGGLFRHFGGAV
jgi:hypothetical protein